MNSPLWISAAAGLVVELVRDLVGDLRRRAPEIVVEEAARRIADAVMAAPIDKLPPAVLLGLSDEDADNQMAAHARAHVLMAETLVDSLAGIAGLSDKTRKRLRVRVGRKLLNATAKKLAKAADDALEATARWEKVLK
jgi:hypothetical protein